MVEIGPYIIDIELIAIVAGPIVSMVAIIFYARALSTANKQNKVFLSQNIKPNFEKEIQHFIIQGSKEKSQYRIRNTSESITFKMKDIGSPIFTSIRALINNKDYRIELEKAKTENCTESLMCPEKSFYNNINFLRLNIARNSETSKFFTEIFQFIEEINSSQLIKEDQRIIKKELKRKVLEITLDRYNIMNNMTLLDTYIPQYIEAEHKEKWTKLKNSYLINIFKKIDQSIL